MSRCAARSGKASFELKSSNCSRHLVRVRVGIGVGMWIGIGVGMWGQVWG